MILGKKDDKKTEREKVDERRDEVLAKGRKFKYPLQYAKHKLVLMTIIVSVVTVIALGVAGWAALYRFHASGDMLYRITQVLPIRVAEIDGEKVLFSDYLLFYKSSMNSVEQQAEYRSGDTDLELMKEEYRRMALDTAEEYTYALKLAKELGASVSEEQVAKTLEEHRKVGGVERSEESFLKILQDNFGISASEYKRMLKLSLTKVEVEQKIDEAANETATKIEQMLAANGGNFAAVAEMLGETVIYEETGRLVDNTNIDGGRANKAATMGAGEQSGKFVSSNGDGYYFIKVIDKTDTQVNYVSIKVPFTAFADRLTKAKEDGLIKEYISFKEITEE